MFVWIQDGCLASVVFIVLYRGCGVGLLFLHEIIKYMYLCLTEVLLMNIDCLIEVLLMSTQSFVEKYQNFKVKKALTRALARDTIMYVFMENL